MDQSNRIHKTVVAHLDQIQEWFKSKRTDLAVPIYSSFDIRDSGSKAAIVDANIFPAGFNNICQVDKDEAVDIMHEYFEDHYDNSKKILLITEEHTNNPYYWSNVQSISKVITQTGREVVVAIPGEKPFPLNVESMDGQKFEVHSAKRVGNDVEVQGFKPDIIVSNNDFSNAYAEWTTGLKTPMNPPHQFGWHRRKKSEFFQHYNQLATEFSELVGVDPWHFTVETELFPEFDVSDDGKRHLLAAKVDGLIEKINAENAKHGVSQKPYVVIKNNAGTYGLGITMVESGKDVMSWNYKSRKTMKAAKGGRDIEEVILQEGILTKYFDQKEAAEPVIYMIGCQLAGGFLRTHQERGPEQNLNAPGAVYKRLCVSDLKVSVQGHPYENVYGWIAKLGLLAISLEAQKNAVEFLGYHSSGAC